MENNDSKFIDVRKRKSDDNFSSQDWEIIDEVDVNETIDCKFDQSVYDNDNDENHVDNKMQNISQNANIRRRLVISSRQSVEEIDSKQLEDSDISVISDTEIDLPSFENDIGAPRNEITNLCQTNQSFDKTTLQVGVIMVIIAIACSLGATIIFRTVCILNLHNGHILKGNELENIDKVNNALLQLNENILATTKLYKNVLQERTKDVFHVFNDDQTTANQIFGTSSTDSEMISLEQLHTFYHAFCSIMNQVYQGNNSVKEQVCMFSNTILDLIHFKKRVNTMLNKLKNTYKSPEKSFLYKVEDKINTTCQSLIFDLVDIMPIVMTTISDKLYDKNNYLNKKLCDLKSEIVAESEFSNTFGEFITFLNSCNSSHMSDDDFKQTDSNKIYAETNNSNKSQIQPNKSSLKKVAKGKNSKNLKNVNSKKSIKHTERTLKKQMKNEFNGSWQFQRSHERDKFRNFGPELSYSNKNWFLQRANSRFYARKRLDYGKKYNRYRIIVFLKFYFSLMRNKTRRRDLL